MLKVTWRNLVARKLRLLLSAFAIVLGVAFVAGTLVFTHAMGAAFDDIIQGSTADAEVAYKGADSFNSAQDARTLPASLVTRLQALPEVGRAYPQNSLQTVFVIGSSGKVVGGNGPPGLAFNTSGVRNMAGEPVLRLTDGALPDGPGKVALELDTAQRAGYSVGDTVRLVTPGTPPSMTARVTGLVKFGGGGLNGATITVFDTGFMHQAFFGGKDVYNSISLSAAPGVTQTQLAAAAQKVLPPGVVARTGDAKVKADQASLDKVLGFIRTFLLVFAGVALVVGIFLILNTFSILVAQRSRELALLRALGASRGQVNRSVLLEALAVGLIGSVVGLGVGYLLALLLKYVFGRFGLDLGNAAFPLTLTAVVASFVVGIVVTAIAGLLPARRAARVAPVTALRDDQALPEPALRRRSVAGAALAVLGAGTMALGFTRDGGLALSLIGLGILLVLVGVSLTSALLGRPLIRLFGLAYRRLFGSIGSLATQNSLRNPRRTAATASALMIGLALMSMMAIFGGSASASTDDAVNKALTSQFIVSNVAQQPFATSIAGEIRRLDGVESVAALKEGFPKVNGRSTFVGAVDPKVITRAVSLPVLVGSLDRLGPGTIAVDATTAQKEGLRLGSRLRLKFQGGTVPVQVVAVYGGGNALGLPYLVTDGTLLKGGLAPLDSFLFVTKQPGADTTTVRDEINRVLKDLPTVTVKDPEGFAAEQKTQIDQLLSFIYGLLALSVVIAALGVVNTLSLSVIERTREVGLLRAVGVSRRQLRTMIRLESLAIAVFGAVLGLVMGTVFGLAVVRALHDDGLTTLQIPWPTLVAFVLVAALIGVLAAVVPARRAARLDVLAAITAD